MNEHIHNDGVAVIIYGQRLTLDEARAALGALRDSVALADSLAWQAEEAARAEKRRAELLAAGWEPADDPGAMVRLIPGQPRCSLSMVTRPLYVVRHRPVPVRVYGGRFAHVATGAPYCDCGAFVRNATVLPGNHGLPMCRAHRGAP